LEDEVDVGMLADTIAQLFLTLTSKEANILKLRFGFGCTPHTLEEVGAKYKVTRERIRQIEAKALKKLKHPSRRKMLKDYLD